VDVDPEQELQTNDTLTELQERYPHVTGWTLCGPEYPGLARGSWTRLAAGEIPQETVVYARVDHHAGVLATLELTDQQIAQFTPGTVIDLWMWHHLGRTLQAATREVTA
jgi:hypothetical protein